MKIESIDQKCYIELSRIAENDWPSFLIRVHVSIGHGSFVGENRDMALLNLAEFVEEFDQFILNRGLSPRLEGTYGTYLAFSGKGGSVFLAFCVGDAFSGYARTSEFALSGSFEVQSEFLLGFLSAFKKLQERPKNSLKANAPDGSRR